MLAVLSISRLLKKESGLKMWVMMMMVVAWVLIETVKLYGNQDREIHSSSVNPFSRIRVFFMGVVDQHRQ